MNQVIQNPSPRFRATKRNPRVRQLVKDLKRQIETHALASGDKLPSIRDLMTRHGSPYRSVQSAMERLEQLGLVERIQGSGTYVTEAGASRSNDAKGSNQVHLIFSGQPDNVAKLIQPVMTRLQGSGFLPLPVFVEERGRQPELQLAHVLRQWETQPPCAVVLKSSRPDVIRLIQQHCPASTHVIVAYTPVTQFNRKWDSVSSDEFDTYGLAAQYLLRQGHRRIGLLISRRSPMKQQTLEMARARRAPQRSMIQAYREAGLGRAWIAHYNPETALDPSGLGTDPATVESLASWLRDKRPTAVVGSVLRLSCLQVAADRAGLRFGEDFEAVGVGDATPAHRGEYVCIAEPCDHIARHVVDLIRAEPSNSAYHVMVPPMFMPRCVHASPASKLGSLEKKLANVAVRESTRSLPLVV
jgi:DNA-binding transcriptional regulator YhcF (GntR family)